MELKGSTGHYYGKRTSPRQKKITQIPSHWKGSVKEQLPIKHPTSKLIGNETNA